MELENIINFENVYVNYDIDSSTLRNINLKIKNNEKMIFVNSLTVAPK